MPGLVVGDGVGRYAGGIADVELRLLHPVPQLGGLARLPSRQHACCLVLQRHLRTAVTPVRVPRWLCAVAMPGCCGRTSHTDFGRLGCVCVCCVCACVLCVCVRACVCVHSYAIRNITAAQLAAVPPQAFATFAHHAIPTYPGAHLVALIPIPAVQALTSAQLAALTPYEFRAFSKDQLVALTAGQRAGLTTQQKQEIKALVGGGPLPPPPANDDDHHPTNDDDHHHHTTTDDDHHTTGKPPGGGLSGGIIALIVIGVVAVAGGFGAAFYIKVWKPRSQGSGDFYAMRDEGV